MKDQVVLSSKWYEKTWLVILLCILFFPVGLYALWRNSSIKKGWKVGVTLFFAIVVVANITKDKKTTPSKDNVVSKKEEIVKESVVKEPKSNWQYSEDKDEMTSQKRLFATCLSTNEIQFEFPYNGGSFFTLTVRNMGNGNEVVLEVSKGQFMSGFNSALRLKFDDEQPMSIGYSDAADGSSNVIFLNSSNKIISKLKTAKKLLIEATFFSAGSKHIQFDVSGLKWN